MISLSEPTASLEEEARTQSGRNGSVESGGKRWEALMLLLGPSFLMICRGVSACGHGIDFVATNCVWRERERGEVNSDFFSHMNGNIGFSKLS